MAEKDKDFLEGLSISVACHVLPARKVFREPIAYSYNGVILPALPEWDREAYPYVLLYEGIGGYILKITDIPGTYVTSDSYGKQIFYPDVSFFTFQIQTPFEDNEWYGPGNEKHYTDYKDYRTDMLWSNYDVLDEDGSVYFAASDPVPLYKFLGYSYNGTILPKLPEWDKTVYPYAVLQDNGNYHRLTVSSKPPYAEILSNTVYISVDSDAKGSTWELYTGDADWTVGWYTASVLVAKPILWANYDVKYEDGTDYLSASEPIPVYE